MLDLAPKAHFDRHINKRRFALDLLRIIAAFGVVWLHVSTRVLASSNPHSFTWLIANMANSMSRWCVPVFVMISGAFLLKAPPSGPFEFYRKRLSRILIPLAFWTIFYLGIVTVDAHRIYPRIILLSLIKGEPYYHLWYLYMVAGLYLAAPFLQQVVAANSAPTVRALALACFSIAAIESHAQTVTFIPSFLLYSGYFIAGHHLANTPAVINKWSLVLSALGCGIVTAFGTWWSLPKIGAQAYDLFWVFVN